MADLLTDRREEVKRILRIFGRGCTHAGLQSSAAVPGEMLAAYETGITPDEFYNTHPANPASCDECLDTAVDQIMKAFPCP